jgi:hypothetical protein
LAFRPRPWLGVASGQGTREDCSMAAVTYLKNRPRPVPTMPSPNDNTGGMHVSSLSSSFSISDTERDRRSRADRPRLASRKPSGSILVPRDHPEIEIGEEEFPPDDARAMSPRRNSADVERLGKEARETLHQSVPSSFLSAILSPEFWSQLTMTLLQTSKNAPVFSAGARGTH